MIRSSFVSVMSLAFALLLDRMGNMNSVLAEHQKQLCKDRMHSTDCARFSSAQNPTHNHCG